jgi:uncharacterized protein YjdB
VIDGIRNRLQTEVAQLTAKRKEIQEITIPQTEKSRLDLEETNNKIEALRNKVEKAPTDEMQLKDIESFKSSLEGLLRGKTTENLNHELKRLDDDISWKEEQQKCVNAKILEYSATPEQDFKRTMSMIFSVLIGLVIAGFFTMAWIDPAVRRAIFSGQTGLQFVTLFSIVIAIILFGITGILEGKELAALLGGLSGYILGRISSPAGNGGSGSQNSVGGTGGGSSNGSGIDRIEILPTSLTLTQKEPRATLRASAFDANDDVVEDMSGDPLTWQTDNPQVATVDGKGIVTRVGAGECHITVKAGEASSNTCTVKCE